MMLLSACTPEAPIPAIDPPAVITPSPNAEGPARETGLAAPARVFGGDCAAILPGDILGSGSAQQDSGDLLGPTENAIPQRGGVACGWQSPRDTLQLVTIPEAAVSSAPDSITCGPNTADADWLSLCRFDRTTNTIRVAGYFGTLLAHGAAEAALEAVLAVFDTATAKAAPVSAPISAEGSWSNPVDCVGLAAAVDVAAFYNNTPRLERFDAGNGSVRIDIEDDIFDGPYGLNCTWGTNVTLTEKHYASGMSRGFGADVLGGARWAESSVASLTYATEISVPGVDKAYLVRGANDTTTVLHLFTGVNYLAVYRDGGPGVDIGPSDFRLIADLIAELDASATK